MKKLDIFKNKHTMYMHVYHNDDLMSKADQSDHIR